MRLISTATAVAVAGVLAVGADAQQPTTQQKSKMKGTPVALTGCLHSSGDVFTLTNVSQEGTAIESLVDSPVVLRRTPDSAVDLSGHVGHRVTIAGAMPKAGEDKSKAHSDDRSEVKGKKKMKYEADPEGRPVVLVTSLTHVSPTCP